MKISIELPENIKIYEQLLATLEGNAFGQRACYLIIGYSYYQLQRYQEANKAFSMANQLILESHRFDIPAVLSKAHCHFENGEYLEVTRLLAKVDHAKAKELHYRAFQKLNELENETDNPKSGFKIP